ncbi:hypothetical protein E1180_13885 [Roseibium denhamense]|uniref:Uncharacterized protein n=1 Tax=Roseibium denhamense TaxID=76305 RepID=A0ABY1NBP2_9HYPH|nr:hypothetical protein [Roseibium denhamense]MTI06608.1 hypothetical protein [Roseibium denhamense]SMP05665.1 hypothetical protein SAMN06265374_0726 [Roseibium denhamense]
MNRTVLTLLAIFVSGKAFAHAGSHDEVSGLGHAIAHFVSSPFHLLLLAAAILLLGTLFACGRMTSLRQRLSDKRKKH